MVKRRSPLRAEVHGAQGLEVLTQAMKQRLQTSKARVKSSAGWQTKRVIAAVAVAGLFLWSGAEISTAGGRITVRAVPQNAHRPGASAAPAPVFHRNGRHQFHGTLGHPHYRHDYYYYPPYWYYHTPVIIVAPSYYYPYYHAYYSP
jgi:hypothetical protein